jgi:hypothetical protein
MLRIALWGGQNVKQPFCYAKRHWQSFSVKIPEKRLTGIHNMYTIEVKELCCGEATYSTWQ